MRLQCISASVRPYVSRRILGLWPADLLRAAPLRADATARCLHIGAAVN